MWYLLSVHSTVQTMEPFRTYSVIRMSILLALMRMSVVISAIKDNGDNESSSSLAKFLRRAQRQINSLAENESFLNLFLGPCKYTEAVKKIKGMWGGSVGRDGSDSGLTSSSVTTLQAEWVKTCGSSGARGRRGSRDHRVPHNLDCSRVNSMRRE